MMRRLAIALILGAVAASADAQAPTPQPAPKKLSFSDKDLKPAKGESKAARPSKVSSAEALAWLTPNKLSNSTATEIMEEADRRGITLGQILDWIKSLRREALDQLAKLESEYKKLKKQADAELGEGSAEAKQLKTTYEEGRNKLKLGIRMADDAIKQFAPLAKAAGAAPAPDEDPMALFDLGRLSAMSAEQMGAEIAARKLTTEQILEGMKRVRNQAAQQLATAERDHKKHMPEMEKAYGAASREARQYADAHAVSTSKLQKLIDDADALLKRHGVEAPPQKGASGAP